MAPKVGWTSKGAERHHDDGHDQHPEALVDVHLGDHDYDDDRYDQDHDHEIMIWSFEHLNT